MSPTIAHVLTSLQVGGAERVALDLARHHIPLGHPTMAISLDTLPDGPLHQAFTEAGATIRHVPKRAGFDAPLLLKLARLFRRERIRIVHTHNALPLIYAAPAAKLAGAQVIHTEHGRHTGRGRSLSARRVAVHAIDSFVAVSAATLEFARLTYRLGRSNTHVIPNGIDLSVFRPDPGRRQELRRELGIPESACAIGTVGRLSPEKNHTMLVSAVAPLLAQGCHLVIAGGGSEVLRLQAQIARLPGSDHVHLLGERRDVARVLAALDVFALSSITEGLPLALLEAMATALPVVATAVGGVPAVVSHGHTGFLAASGDLVHFTRHLAGLVSDRPLRNQLGENGRHIAATHHDARVVAQSYLHLYRLTGRCRTA